MTVDSAAIWRVRIRKSTEHSNTCCERIVGTWKAIAGGRRRQLADLTAEQTTVNLTRQ